MHWCNWWSCKECKEAEDKHLSAAGQYTVELLQDTTKPTSMCWYAEKPWMLICIAIINACYHINRCHADFFCESVLILVDDPWVWVGGRRRLGCAVIQTGRIMNAQRHAVAPLLPCVACTLDQAGVIVHSSPFFLTFYSSIPPSPHLFSSLLSSLPCSSLTISPLSCHLLSLISFQAHK